MKKLVVLLMLFIGLKVTGQTYPPKPNIVGYIDQVIKNNPEVLIRGNVMNRILKEVLNYPVDTIWIVSDTLKYRQNGAIYNRLLSTGDAAGVTLALQNLGQGVRMASLNPSADTLSFKRLLGDSTMTLTVLSDSTLRLSANTRHPNLQFQDEGIDLGDSGTVVTLNFTGPNVVAARSGQTVDVTITGGGGVGADGNNYPTSVNISAGTLNIARDGLSTISTPITTADIPEVGSLYYTDARARSSISALGPLVYNPTTGILSADTALLATKTDVSQVKVKTLIYDSTNKILTLTLQDNSTYADTIKGAGDNWGSQFVIHDNSMTGDGVLASPLSVDTNRIVTKNYLTFKIDSLNVPDTLMFYRIEGVDSLYIQVNDEILAVLDSTSYIEFFDEGAPIGSTSKINFIGAGVVTQKIGDVIQVSIPGGGVGGASDGNNYPLSVNTDNLGVMTIERFGLTPIRDTLSTSNIPEGSRLYYTDPRARNAISGTGAITYSNITGVIGADTASLATVNKVQQKIDSLAALAMINIYNSNGTLTGPRTIFGSSTNTLSLSGSDFFANGVRVGQGARVGNGNVAVGNFALYLQNGGGNNTAVGQWAGSGVRANSNNTYIGSYSGSATHVAGADRNTAIGEQALRFVTAGDDNNAFGAQALRSLTTGVNNTTVGSYGLTSLTTGSFNTVIGTNAGAYGNGSYNTFIGEQSGLSAYGNSNVFIGYSSGAYGYDTVNNRLVIQNNGDLDPLVYGNFLMDTLRFNSSVSIRDVTQNDALSRVLVHDAATGKVQWRAASTLDLTTANNGLTMTGNNIKLGGTLLESTTITANAYNFILTGTAGTQMYVQTTGNTGLQVEVSGVSGTGVVAYGRNIPFWGINTDLGTSNVDFASVYNRQNSTAAVGMGLRHSYNMPSSTGNTRNVGYTDMIWTNATDANESAKWVVGLRYNGLASTDKLTLSSAGLRLHDYGDGTITGTATYNLAVDASGNVIQVALGGGGGGTTETASNGLTKVTNDIQLGGLLTANTQIDGGTNTFEIFTSDPGNASQYTSIAVYNNSASMYVDDGTDNSDISVGSYFVNATSNTLNLNARTSGSLSTMGGTGQTYVRVENATDKIELYTSLASEAASIEIDPTGIKIFPDGGTTEGTILTYTSTGYIQWQIPRERKISTKTANYTVTGSDHTILVDASAGNVTITLPDYTGPLDEGAIYIVKKMDSSGNTVTLDPAYSYTIDATTTKVLTSQWQYVVVKRTDVGANWVVIGGN